MTTPNAEVSDHVEPTDDSAADDALLADFDALDDPERASAEFVGDDPEPGSTDEKAAAPRAESPPTDEAPPADTPPDPFAELLKDATPATYKVDGQERTFDGFVVTKSGHGVVPPEQVERLRNTLGLAEKSIADNKVLYERTQRFERLGGEQKLAALEEQVAQLDAAGTQLLAILNDPTALLMLDAEGNVVKNPKAISDLTDKLQFASKVAGFEAKQKFQQSVQQQQQGQQDASQRGRALEAVIAQLHAQYPDLTLQDVAAARAHFGQFASALFRQAGPEDAQQYGYRIGEWLIDTPKMHPFFEERAQFRKEQATTTKKRDAAEAENRKRQAVVSPPRPRKGESGQPRNKDGTYAEKQAERERVRSEMKRAHRRGEFYTDTTAERDV